MAGEVCEEQGIKNSGTLLRFTSEGEARNKNDEGAGGNRGLNIKNRGTKIELSHIKACNSSAAIAAF